MELAGDFVDDAGWQERSGNEKGCGTRNGTEVGGVADAARTLVTAVLVIVDDDLDQKQKQEADE
jgi:hypothetical protein